jgi:hypothetical protein
MPNIKHQNPMNWDLEFEIWDFKQSAQGGLAQLARAPALQAGGHRFESDILHQEGGILDLDFRFWI